MTQKERKKRYYEKNKKKCLEKTKEWKLKNKEHIQKYNKLYIEKNTEKIKEYRKYACVDSINNQKFRRIQYFGIFFNNAVLKGGKVLSEPFEYKTAHSKLSIKCQKDHIFPISWCNLKANKWCPECCVYQNELLTKQFLEHMFNTKFKKIRPDWLRNKEGNKIEIDMYSEKYNLAVEYNGMQHYIYTKHFHKTEDKFNKTVEHDKIKLKVLKEKGINFIVVPYNTKNIYDFLKVGLNELGIYYVNKEIPKIENGIFLNKGVSKILNKIEEKNGSFISRENDIIKIKCNKSHVWESKIEYIAKGAWCHECGKRHSDETKKKISDTRKNKIKNGEISKPPIKQKSEKIIKTEKDCKNCGNVKSIDNFLKKSSSVDGCQSWCKECTNNAKIISRIKQKCENYNCTMCEKVFKLKDSLTRHTKEKHIEIK